MITLPRVKKGAWVAASRVLGAQRLDGSVLAWQFEAVTLKLAHNTRYTPDFMVVAAGR